MNKVSVHEDFKISEQAKKLHSQLLVADLHTDSLLWKRDLTKREARGHVDIPRLEAGNVALQLFTAVTKSPAGQNYEENYGSSDNITTAAIAQMWPMRTWDSLAERALYQSEKLHAFAKAAPTKIAYVTTAGQLQRVLRERASGKKSQQHFTVSKARMPWMENLKTLTAFMTVVCGFWDPRIFLTISWRDRYTVKVARA